MRLFTRVSKGLLVATTAITAMVGLSACGPDYTYFRVHITAGGLNTDRDRIYECLMTITDQDGKAVVTNWQLEKSWTKDVDGNPIIEQGCQGGLTKAVVGNFSYSTSRTSGSLTFRVDALDNSGVVVQTKTSDARSIPCPTEFRDTVEGTCRVDVAMAIKTN